MLTTKLTSRVTRDALVTRAVAVLEEAWAATHHGPVEPTPGLRLALAVLYALSDDRTHPGHGSRDAFADFLTAIARPPSGAAEAQDGRGRAAEARGLLNHIRRRVGQTP